MLREINIRNVAIIEQQSVVFGPGLNVITGETGAGKSIILDSLELVLGGRASTDLIRTGANSLEVEALIDISNVPARVKTELPELFACDELVVSREINRHGRGKVYINGRIATVGMLDEVISRFINICSQSHHTRLLQNQYHREILDDFAGNSELLEQYHKAYVAWKHEASLLKKAEEIAGRSELRKHELEAIITDIEPAAVRSGMRAELESEIKRLKSGEEIILKLRSVVDSLSDHDGPLVTLKRVRYELDALSKLDEDLKSPLNDLNGAMATIEDLDKRLSKYLSGVLTDEYSLEKHRNDLSRLARLERKYRLDDAGLANLLLKSQVELNTLQDPHGLSQLSQKVEALHKEVKQLADLLTDARIKAGKTFAKLVQGELAEVSMGGTQLEVSREPATLSDYGADKIEFLISPNRGELLRPLKQIASGGELSRLMLCLKKVLNESFGVNVLVFDEVDTGISGSIARSVGEKLRALASNSQVICITHLPQVASLAHRHYLVKKGGEDRISAGISLLSDTQRIEEIARMLAGYKITDASRESARELLASNS